MPNGMVVRLAVAAVLTASLTGSSGYLLTISKIVMLSLALLHAVLAGSLLSIYLVYAFSLPVPVTLFSVLFTVALSLLAAELVERGLPIDSAVAVIAAISTTLIATFGYLDSILSPIAVSEAWSYVAGLSVFIRDRDLAILTGVTSFVVPLVVAFRREFTYIAFDEEGARAMGMRVRVYRYLLYSLSAAISAAVAICLGVFVAHVALAVPGSLALRLGRKRLYLTSLAASALVMFVGYTISYPLKLPPSSGVGIVATLALLATLLKGGRRG